MWQVFKGGLSRSGTEEGVQFRYFAAAELRDLFTASPAAMAASETQATLEQLHGGQRQASPATLAHMEFLQTLPGFTGARLDPHALPCSAVASTCVVAAAHTCNL